MKTFHLIFPANDIFMFDFSSPKWLFQRLMTFPFDFFSWWWLTGLRFLQWQSGSGMCPPILCWFSFFNLSICLLGPWSLLKIWFTYYKHMDLKSVRYLYCPNFTYLNTSDKAYNTRQLILIKVQQLHVHCICKVPVHTNIDASKTFFYVTISWFLNWTTFELTCRSVALLKRSACQSKFSCRTTDLQLNLIIH